MKIRKLLLNSILLLALLVSLTACGGGGISYSGEACPGLVATTSETTVSSNGYASYDEAAAWYRSLIGRTCGGRPITEVKSIGPAYGYLVVQVKLG